MFTKGDYPMADSTYSVRIDEHLKDKTSDLIKGSGLNSLIPHSLMPIPLTKTPTNTYLSFNAIPDII
jgi:hypothetical protein